MAILVRCSSGDSPVEVTTVQLETMIKSGQVQANSLIHDRILTDGEWRTADNLYLFHSAAPGKHAYGPHLQAQEMQVELRRKQREEASEVYTRYSSGTLIEDSFGLEPLDRLVKGTYFFAACRLIAMPSFQAERIVTIAFAVAHVDVVLSQSPSAAWNLVTQHECKTNPDGSWREMPRQPFFRARVEHRALRATRKVAEELLGDLGEFLRLGCTPQAERDWMVLDGTGFRHRVHSNDLSSDVTWSNPAAELDHRPLQVLRLYRGLLLNLGCPDFLPAYDGTRRPPDIDLSKFRR